MPLTTENVWGSSPSSPSLHLICHFWSIIEVRVFWLNVSFSLGWQCPCSTSSGQSAVRIILPLMQRVCGDENRVLLVLTEEKANKNLGSTKRYTDIFFLPSCHGSAAHNHQVKLSGDTGMIMLLIHVGALDQGRQLLKSQKGQTDPSPAVSSYKQ